tara:strand:+ start:15103 stop:16272 length:1170 start_codon:yes stop_codon:yes gene_type:complete
MQNSPSPLGQKIKRYRLINDIRQEDMAEKMGVSRATLINYEKGHTAINMDVLNRLKNHYPDFQLEEKETIKPKIIVNNSLDFRVLFNVLLDSKKYIILFTLLFITFGTGSSFLFKKYYNAEISLYPAKNDISQGLGQFQSLAANLGMNTANNDQNFNIPDVVRSRLIASKAINQKWNIKNEKSIDLKKLWNLNKIPWYQSFYSTTIDSIAINEKAIKKFNNHIEVNEDRISGLIKISTTFQDPYIAAGVANFIGNQVELYIQKENSAQSTKEKLFISERLLIVKRELEIAELELKNFKESNRGYEDSAELFMIFSQLFREVEAKKEVYLTLQQQLELARIEEVKQSPILHILDHAVPPIRKSFPNRSLFLMISAFLGILISSLHTLFRY